MSVISIAKRLAVKGGLLDGETRVATYRLYCLSEITGGIHAAELVEADTDEEAVAKARLLKERVPCELWDGARMVAKVGPKAGR